MARRIPSRFKQLLPKRGGQTVIIRRGAPLKPRTVKRTRSGRQRRGGGK